MNTKQKLFNLSVNGVLEQGKKAANRNGNCKLKLKGLSCAVGILIDDEYYNKSLEKGSLCGAKRSVLEAVEKSQDIKHIDYETTCMLLSLQDRHDSAYETSNFTWSHIFLKEVTEYAKFNGLSMEGIEWELTQPTGK